MITDEVKRYFDAYSTTKEAVYTVHAALEQMSSFFSLLWSDFMKGGVVAS